MSVWYQIFSESLTTHSRLNSDDIDWASKLLASFSIEIHKKAMFAMMMNRRIFSGLHSRMFNATVDDIITNRSESRLNELTSRSFANIYPELYDNSLLTEKDRDIVKDIANDEYNGTIMAINGWDVDRTNILPHFKSKLPAGAVNSDKTTYEETYGIICYQNDNKYPKPVDKVTTRDPVSGDVFCFNKNEIAVRFSQGDYTNPITGQPLPALVVEFIKRHLDIEIKLFGRPMDVMVETSIPDRDVTPRNIMRPMLSPTYGDVGSSLPTLKNGRLLSSNDTPNGAIKFRRVMSTPRIDIDTDETTNQPSDYNEDSPILESRSLKGIEDLLEDRPKSTPPKSTPPKSTPPKLTPPKLTPPKSLTDRPKTINTTFSL